MSQTNSKLTLALSLLLGITAIPMRAMEPFDAAQDRPDEPAYESLEQRMEAARLRAEAVQEKARINIERAEQAKKAYAQTMQRQKMIEAGNAIDTSLKRWDQVMKEADETMQQATLFLADERANKELEARVASPKPQSFVIPVESLNNAFDNDPELNALLLATPDDYFKTEAGPSDAQVIEDAFGPETGLTVPAAIELPGTPLTPRVASATVEVPVIEPLPAVVVAVAEPIATEPKPVRIPVAQPVDVNPGLPARLTMPDAPAPSQRIDESFVASVLNNILGAKGPMVTAGTLGVVHYLYENKVFNQAMAVRSPKVKAFLHDYALPTAREALAAHLIQLVLPHLPYLRDKDIRSFGTVNYLSCFITTKMLGNTALYFAKMVTDSEQGKKLVTHYNRLPKKTQNTIAKVLPWLAFARNMFMARSLASYFE